jgi:hypothetical protein
MPIPDKLLVILRDNPPPDWAHWLAQDADGAVWAFEVEPLQSHNGWYENELGRNRKLADGAPNSDWRQALFRLQQ